MAKREFVQLAHKLDVQNLKQHIGGWFLSEKLDGERCFWDGGVSRGIDKNLVPWANIAKDERYVATQVATGLWSRYGNVIHAPDWWLDKLPKTPLDGELWSLDGAARQFIHSWIKKIIPNTFEWQRVTYMVFDSPPLETILADGLIDNTNFQKRLVGCIPWIQKRESEGFKFLRIMRTQAVYRSVDIVLGSILEVCDKSVVRLHCQEELPFPMPIALQVIENRLKTVLDKGGEGLIIRKPETTYKCERVHTMLKYKPFDDMEGTVIGYITGRETDKGSKLLGMMGALVLMLDSGVRLELSGFTDEERRLQIIRDMGATMPAVNWAAENPEKDCPDWIEAKMFPRGTRVTFKYRGLSADGVPIEARYWRNRND